MGGGRNDEGAKNRRMALRLVGSGRCTWFATTSSDGIFVIEGLPVGAYDLWPVGTDCLQPSVRFDVQDGKVANPIFNIEHPDNLQVTYHDGRCPT
jgi:hypothetical protein